MKQYYKITLFFLLLFIQVNVNAQKELLQSGPLVGYSEMRDVALWVQTKEAAKVKIIYYDKENPAAQFETNEVITSEADAFTAHFVADKVEPGKKYNYKLFLNNSEIKFDYPLEFRTLNLWQWRTDAPDFSFAAGSCAHINEPEYDRPGKPYGGNYEIFASIKNKAPEFMLWMGDNVYLREADWNTRTGILKRYTHTRSLPEMQPLLASVHNYAIWDDHDFGPNNSDRGFIHKDKTLEAFKLFWANPTYGINGAPGITTKFEWSDAEFFLLDDRYYRTPEFRTTGARVIFGDEQINWLIDALTSSKAVFKIIVSGGQILNPSKSGESFSNFPEERDKLLNLIQQEKISGVIFLTGDIHSSQVTKMNRDNNYPLYEFTISPLTAGVSVPKDNQNPWVVPEYKTTERNFAYFTVNGTKGNRIITCINYNSAGKEMWRLSLNENELRQ